MEQYYYSTATGQTYSAYQLQALFGIDTNAAAVEVINGFGFYPVQANTPGFDLGLYNYTYAWTLVPITGGQGAERAYTPVAKPLPEAKANGSAEVKQQADAQTTIILTANSLSSDVLASVASQDPLARPAQLQAVLDETVAVSDALGANLTAIENATSVDEINNIVNKPSGILFTGRGSGLGPEDLNVSYYVEFNSMSMDQSQTELYVPGTSTVIPYLLDPITGKGTFDSIGNCFNPGDYLIQIRETATSMVIAEFEVPLNPAGENVTF